jgi:ubiquitin C-terminal hydrolase
MKDKVMFGLRNYSGSCWVNGCLQAFFRIPEIQTRYNEDLLEYINDIDRHLHTIYKSKGEVGLKDFFDSVRTGTMPAGQGIGDSNELFVYLCDKLPFLDELCRFKIANTIKCNSCGEKNTKEDDVIEFMLSSEGKFTPISECISKVVQPQIIDTWKCEKCKNTGCTTQQLIGTFPKAMVFNMVTPDTSVNYSSILVLNQKKYALSSVICYSGSHWWTRARDMPPGSSWYTLDDTRVINHGPDKFPVSNMMRILIYYRLEN